MLAHDKQLLAAYFLEKAVSVIDNPRGVRCHSGEKVAVSDQGIESIEGGQLLLPPSVVSVALPDGPSGVSRPGVSGCSHSGSSSVDSCQCRVPPKFLRCKTAVQAK